MGKLTSRRVAVPPTTAGGQASRLSCPTGFQPVVSANPHPWLLLLLGILLTCVAQSAPAANTPAPQPKNPPSGKPAAASPTPNESELTATTPSRFITEENIATYVASASAMFSMRGRATDPFGQMQDPDAKPIIKTASAKASHRAAALQATPFSEIIRLIKVTTVMPKEKRFLVGTRAIKQGDSIPLNYRGKTLRVEVSAVSSHQIEFRNLESNESASLKLDLLPAGMTPGSRLMAAPGMLPDRPEAPIELESGNPLNDKPQNR